MYSTAHPVSAPMNGMGGELVDGSGTINPAALNTAGLVAPSVAATALSSRGLKRSRSPDQSGHNVVEDNHEADDQGRRKRGRPPKIPRPSGSATGGSSHAAPPPNVAAAVQSQTPQLSSQTLPHHSDMSPPQTSPPLKTTPTKPMVKALPTVRDHTTDQLSPEGDEYIPKEFDEAGEKKVDALGYLQGGREYKCRTFRVPNRGDKLFMLATECARVLGYRDSYLLFNKNRSLYKIIASQIEKDNLIQQDILPYSYRSRQIAIVTAKSMFRQFGSRVIQNGRRVRDDYWESKARKQGFTEEDLAGEKRPGAAKARDAAAAAEAAANATMLPNLSHSDVVYSSMDQMSHGIPPGLGAGTSLAPLPMINLSNTDDIRLREYNTMPRSRQELTGQPYQDRNQSGSATEIMNHASHTADFNKILNSQRAYRNRGMDEFYAAQRDIPISVSQSQPGQLDATTVSSAGQALQSPQLHHTSSGMVNPSQQQPQPQQGVLGQAQPLLSQSGYSQQTHPHQSPSISQSPIRGVSQAIRPDVMHQRAPNPNPAISSPVSAAQTPAVYGGYGSQASQMWGQPPPQPQPSPIAASPHMGIPQYSVTQMHSQQHQSPSPLPHHAQQPQPPQPPHQSPSPHNQHRPSQQQQIPQSLHMHQQVPQAGNMASLGYQGGPAGGYQTVANARQMYAPGANPGQQFLAGAHQQSGMTMAMGGGTQGIPGWPSGAGTAQMQAGAPPQGQSGTPLGGWSSY